MASAIDNSSRKLLPGMTASVTVKADEAKDVLMISAMALQYKPSAAVKAAMDVKKIDDIAENQDIVYLFENGKIETTVTRAKEVRAMAEKMVTLGKSDDLHSKRQVYSFITKETVAKKVIDELGPKYADRSGGYTRIIKIGARRGDAAEMAIIELV